ncbi:MAG: aminotransferase class V-fold PLP-dependent enzyme [Gaiellaceae bacterium]
MPTFPVLERVAYLNAGTFGPLAQETVDAVVTQARLELERGRGGKRYFDTMIDLRDRLRGLFAELLGAAPDHVALTASTTMGCQIVLSGLRLEPGDEIVTTDEEHFGLLGPLHVSGARVRVAATRGRAGDEALAAVLAEVGPRTRLVALSHVSWVTGHILPVEAIKTETGVPLLVDGAQSVGAIPVDVRDADFYTVSGQKWLCGPDATGALYVRDLDALAVSLPTYWSREAHELDGTFAPVDSAQRFDTGPIPVPSLAGLEVALQSATASRYEAARATTERCRALLSERFDVVTAPDQATLVTFVPDGAAADAVARLFDAGVVVRDIPETGWVRVSCGYWNTEEHLQRLLDALA